MEASRGRAETTGRATVGAGIDVLHRDMFVITGASTTRLVKLSGLEVHPTRSFLIPMNLSLVSLSLLVPLPFLPLRTSMVPSDLRGRHRLQLLSCRCGLR